MFPRGIAPDLLLAGVKNTVPYFAAERSLDSFPPAEFLRGFAGGDLSRELSHFEYFRLCLSAHYLTCGTPVPTDVDNQIRHRLWPKNLPLEIALEMAGLVLESRDWDFRKVSERHVEIDTKATAWIAGHHGEWFTVAAGAYGALAQYSAQSAKDLQAQLLDAIGERVTQHSEVFGELWRAGDGVQALRASAVIAHNFGDLDRVMEMWSLSVTDPLRLNFHGLTTKALSAEGKLRYLGRLWVAGELYKSPIAILEGESSMAFENHRHFALRKPRALRQSRELLIPLGPFFDEWGRRVVDRLSEGETNEVTDALQHGWERLPRTFGYARALRSIYEKRPDLRPKGEKRQILGMDQDRFERIWSAEALKLMDDIPSRA